MLFIKIFHVHTLLYYFLAAQGKPDFSVAETLESFLPCILVEREPGMQKGPHLQPALQGIREQESHHVNNVT